MLLELSALHPQFVTDGLLCLLLWPEVVPAFFHWKAATWSGPCSCRLHPCQAPGIPACDFAPSVVSAHMQENPESTLKVEEHLQALHLRPPGQGATLQDVPVVVSNHVSRERDRAGLKAAFELFVIW